MSVPKLYYFDIMGRAEMIRLVLAAAGKPFKDIRFSFEEWPKSYQKKSPFGLCPWVEIDGEVFGQSVAIATYFARQNDLYGKTDKECLQIDQLLNVIQDFLALSTKIFKETDKDKKADLLKICQEKETQRYYGYFETLLKRNGSGYFVGDRLTLADIAVFDLVTGWMKNFTGPIDNFPLANALVSKVAANDKIKAYMAKRKVTEG